MSPFPFFVASVLVELPKQPGPGKSPIALGSRARDVEGGGSLFQAAPREKAELDQLRLLRMQGF
jgi:hypothetical protein